MKTLANQMMKQLVMRWMVAMTIMALITSCGEDELETDLGNDVGIPVEVEDDVDLETEAGIESVLEDLDGLTEAGMDAINAAGRSLVDELLECATVTHDEDNQTLTIDYGDGCEGPRGRVRSGKIIVNYTDRRLVPGAMRTVTLEDFKVDSVQVEGTRIVTNIMETEEDAPKFRIQLIGGQLTFADGTTATREADHTREWIRGANPRLDEAYREGEAEGINRDGDTYRVVILERIVYQRSCGLLPVSGVKEITVNGGEHVITYDYGDGTCDNIVTVTVDGVTEEIEINPRRFKIRRRG